MKKKSQNKQESHTEEIKRYLGALNEDNQSKLDIVIERITGIDENIEIMKTDIEFIKSGLSRKVDYEEFIELERRVSVLESKVRK